MSIDTRKLANGRKVYDVRLRRPDGHPFKRSFPTKRQAEAFEAADRVDRQRGTWIDPNAGLIQLDAYSAGWLHQRPDLGPRTVELYSLLLRRHILPVLGHHDLRELTPAQIRAWHAGLLRAGRPGPTTVAKCYRLLRTILTTAAEDELLVKSPCMVKRAGVERIAERPVATLDQVDRLADATDPRYRAMVLLAVWTGLRLGELAGLSRAHVQVSQATITVQRQLQQLADGTTVFMTPKTDAGRRAVAIPPHILADLADHLDRWVGPHPDDLVFPAPDGGHLRRSNFSRRVWAPAAKKAELTGFRFHDLRHTGNTLAATTGASTKELMARMGHASPRAALIYQHSTAERDRVIAQMLSQIASSDELDRNTPHAPVIHPHGGSGI